MAEPTKTSATSSENQAPGNGDVWGTLHNSDAPSKEGASSTEEKATTQSKANESKDEKPEEKASESVKEDAKGSKAESKADNGKDASSNEDASNTDAEDEDLLDAVLEAEAAAIVDNAMDEVRAEAANGNAQREVAEWKDKYMRLHAEWDTYRRRQKEQREVEKALAAEKLVSSLIPIIDDIERSIDYAEKNGEDGLLGGVQAVLAKFVNTLEKDGVEVIDPKGEAFNALEAQAVGTVDDASQPDETVNDVYQKGYKIGNKVLRPAMVTITTGGPKRPKEESKED